MGGWPVLKGDNWNETDWSLEKSLLRLHDFVGYGKFNVFRNESKEEDKENEIDIDQGIAASNDGYLEAEYPKYMFKVAVALGAEDTEETKQELNDALQFGLALNKLNDGKLFKRTGKVRKNTKEMMIYNRMIKWIKHFDKFKLINTQSNMVHYNLSVIDNIELLLMKVSNKTIANYVLWRIVDLSVPFLSEEVEEAFKFYRETYGVVDKEQRWKTCTRITNRYAELATGSLYIKDFFTEESRIAASDMVKDIKEEFRASIISSEWMDKKTKTEALSTVDMMKSYIGYDEQLLNITKVEQYYVDSRKKFTDTFFHLALQLNVLNTDKKFQQEVFNTFDWTKYAKPTTVGASYNKRDNTIRKIRLV